jgi:hypothetical protein
MSINKYSFLKTHLLLAQWQCDLEQALFAFCEAAAPEVLSTRIWSCPQAAELTLLSEDVARHCMNHKQQMTVLGITGGRREQFLSDLQMARRIRHAAVHRTHVNQSTLKEYSSCVVRVLGAVQDALNQESSATSAQKSQVRVYGTGDE